MNWPASPRRVRELADEFYESLYRYAFRLAGTADRAENLTQETFCRAQMQWRQLRDPERPKPWLFAILRNCFLRELRDQRTARHIPLEAADDLYDAPDQSSFQEITGEAIQAALNSLPEAFRTPVILFYFEEFTYRDIADQMNVPIGTVMSRLARAKAHLRKQLESQLTGDMAGEHRGL
jgi:RNA polymerase sigma-70 factor (ECF subfamily)